MSWPGEPGDVAFRSLQDHVHTVLQSFFKAELVKVHFIGCLHNSSAWTFVKLSRQVSCFFPRSPQANDIRGR